MGLGTALLLSVITALAYISRRIGGDVQLERPIVLAPIVGLLLGDLQTGLIVGGTFELIFIGAAPIGGSIPPNVAVASVLGAAFAITAGEGVETALLIGTPAAVLAVSFELFAKSSCAFLIHWGDRYAELINGRGITGVMWLGNSIHFLAYLVPTFLALYFGDAAVNTLTEALSGQVEQALNAAANILPALGFGLLLSVLTTRVLFPLFLVGFALVSYTDFSTIGVAVLGAAVIIFLQVRRAAAV